MPKTISKIHQPCILKTISENCAAPPHTLLHGPAGPPSSTADLPAAASHSYIHRKPHRRQIYTYLNLPSISGAEKIFSLRASLLRMLFFVFVVILIFKIIVEVIVKIFFKIFQIIRCKETVHCISDSCYCCHSPNNCQYP